MQGHVDVHAGVVQVGDQHWPFDLDLSAGAASMQIDNQLYAVRPLLWREKVMLARFAHLGPTFIQHHFLRLSLAGKLPPAGETMVAALSALALWVNAPDESQPGVPLDVELLGSVTFKVCHAAGLRPADLDERSASEVELIWHAISHAEQPPLASNRPTEDDDGQVRILVLPDPLPEELASVSKAEQNLPNQDSYPKSPSEATQAFDDVAQQVAQQATSMALSGKAVATPGLDQDPESSSKPDTDAIREVSTFADSTIRSPAPPILPKPRTETSSEKLTTRTRETNAFRIFYPTTIIQDKADENFEPVTHPTAQQHRESLPFPTQGTHASSGTLPIPDHSSLRTQRSIETAAPNGIAAALGLMPPLLPPSLSQPPLLQQGQVSQQEASPPIEWGILLDELNEQLEQAADDLGIDLEG